MQLLCSVFLCVFRTLTVPCSGDKYTSPMDPMGLAFFLKDLRCRNQYYRYIDPLEFACETSKSMGQKISQALLLQILGNVVAPYLRSTPHPVTVTTRIITFLVGNPYKPSFATVTGWGVDPNQIIHWL